MTHSNDIAGLIEQCAKIAEEDWTPAYGPDKAAMEDLAARQRKNIAERIRALAALRPAADPSPSEAGEPDNIPERKLGKSKLVYDKTKRAIVVAFGPAADPKAEGLSETAAENLCRARAMEQWEASTKRPDLDEYSRVRGAIEACLRQALALRLLAAPPTPDAERAGEPEAWKTPFFETLRDGTLAPIILWGTPREGAEAALRDGWQPLYASQSPATEAVSEAMVEAVLDAALTEEGWPKTYLPATRVRKRAAVRDALEAARSPVNNSPEPEHVVADVSKAAADTEGATKP